MIATPTTAQVKRVQAAADLHPAVQAVAAVPEVPVVAVLPQVVLVEAAQVVEAVTVPLQITEKH